MGSVIVAHIFNQRFQVILIVIRIPIAAFANRILGGHRVPQTETVVVFGNHNDAGHAGGNNSIDPTLSDCVGVAARSESIRPCRIAVAPLAVADLTRSKRVRPPVNERVLLHLHPFDLRITRQRKVARRNRCRYRSVHLRFIFFLSRSFKHDFIYKLFTYVAGVIGDCHRSLIRYEEFDFLYSINILPLNSVYARTAFNNTQIRSGFLKGQPFFGRITGQRFHSPLYHRRGLIESDGDSFYCRHPAFIFDFKRNSIHFFCGAAYRQFVSRHRLFNFAVNRPYIRILPSPAGYLRRQRNGVQLFVPFYTVSV